MTRIKPKPTARFIPRTARIAPAGEVFHVINRVAGKRRIFASDADHLAFERVLFEAAEKHPTRILSYCVMSNHCRFIVWPRKECELSAFFRWLTHTHAMQWRAAHDSVGNGPLYQGRFKSFMIEKADGMENFCRHVERSALAAGLVGQAQDWLWGSLWTRLQGNAQQRAILSDWPTDRGRALVRQFILPSDRRAWTKRVNAAISQPEARRINASIARGRPFGSENWVERVAVKFRLGHTMRNQGRPRKLEQGFPENV